MTQINEDKLSKESVDTAITVLEHVAAAQSDTDDEQTADAARSLIVEYKRDSEWTGKKPADTINADKYRQLGQTGNR